MSDILKKYNWQKISDRVAEISQNILTIKNDLKKTGELRKEASFFEEFINLKLNLEHSLEVKKSILSEIAATQDPEMKVLCEEELLAEEAKIFEQESLFLQFTYQEDDKDTRSAFLEIRAGTGGQEASLFVSDLARMYQLYAIKRGWNASITDAAATEVGGYREIILFIEGRGVFKYFNFESGVHRVQRVPATENAGRVHTSTVTVAVLPEVESVEVAIDEKDLRVDTYRAGGAGGQHVNKTDSAVRITHIPSGIVVQCQDERSQHKNRAKAMKALQSKLYALEEEKQKNDISQQRKTMVSNADRSEKIRTYNYPQNRVTDHRAGVTLNQLDFIINGNMDGLLEQLLADGSHNKVIHPFLVGYVDE
jgi:peptide chain release factor 1